MKPKISLYISPNEKDINIECDTQDCLKLQDSQSIVVLPIQAFLMYFNYNGRIIPSN